MDKKFPFFCIAMHEKGLFLKEDKKQCNMIN